MSPTVKGYRAAMRKRKQDMPAQPSMARKAGEAVAKKVYKTMSPVVKPVAKAAKKGAVKVLTGYLKGTNAMAKKVEPLVNKLPKSPLPPRRRRMRAK